MALADAEEQRRTLTIANANDDLRALIFRSP